MALIREAEARAEEIVRRAEEGALSVINDAQMQAKARQVQAEQAASNQMDEADRYALEMLKRLQAQLAAFTTTVQAGIESLETAREPDEGSSQPEQTAPN